MCMRCIVISSTCTGCYRYKFLQSLVFVKFNFAMGYSSDVVFRFCRFLGESLKSLKISGAVKGIVDYFFSSK